MAAQGRALLERFDREAAARSDLPGFLAGANEAICAMLRSATDEVLGQVLYEASMGMKNSFSRSDA